MPSYILYNIPSVTVAQFKQGDLHRGVLRTLLLTLFCLSNRAMCHGLIDSNFLFFNFTRCNGFSHVAVCVIWGPVGVSFGYHLLCWSCFTNEHALQEKNYSFTFCVEKHLRTVTFIDSYRNSVLLEKQGQLWFCIRQTCVPFIIFIRFIYTYIQIFQATRKQVVVNKVCLLNRVVRIHGFHCIKDFGQSWYIMWVFFCVCVGGGVPFFQCYC